MKLDRGLTPIGITSTDRGEGITTTLFSLTSGIMSTGGIMLIGPRWLAIEPSSHQKSSKSVGEEEVETPTTMDTHNPTPSGNFEDHFIR